MAARVRASPVLAVLQASRCRLSLKPPRRSCSVRPSRRLPRTPPCRVAVVRAESRDGESELDRRRHDLALVVSSVESLKREVEALRAERRDVIAAGERNAQRAERFKNTLALLEGDAVSKLRGGDEAAARRLVQQKGIVSEAARKASSRAVACELLADKLTQCVDAKQHEMQSLLELGRKVAKRLEVGSEEAPTTPFTEPSSSTSSGISAEPPPPPRKLSSLSNAELGDVFMELQRSSLESLFAQSPDEEAVGPVSREEPAPAADQTSASESGGEEEEGSAGERVDAADGEGEAVEVAGGAADWWTLGLVALQEGRTLRSPGDRADGDGGGDSDTAGERDARAARLIARAANRHSGGEDPGASELQELVALAFPAAADAAEHSDAGPMPLPTASKLARDFPKALRLALLRNGIHSALTAARGGTDVERCRGFVVGLATVLEVVESDAVQLVAELAVEATHRALLSAAVELRKEAGVAAAQLSTEAGRICAAFPPASFERVREAADRLQNFVSRRERQKLKELWRNAWQEEDFATTGEALSDQLLGK